jgi:hypothetical protein
MSVKWADRVKLYEYRFNWEILWETRPSVHLGFEKSLQITNKTCRRRCYLLLNILRCEDRSQIKYMNLFLPEVIYRQPITVAARSKAWNVFAHSNTGIVGSNPIQGMDVCLRLFFVCVRSRLCDGLIPCPWSPTDCLGLRNWSETNRFMGALCSKWEQQE